MADRYWVGGSGSWNSTTKWSATSGGASGASVPTSADNAIFDANSGVATAHYTVTVTDNATCANFTFTPEDTIGVTEFIVGNGFVIAGTFSATGVSTGGNRRVLFNSSTYGLMRDIQIAVIGTVIDADFRDIRIIGAGGTLSGTRVGDLKGNSNITFSTPKTVYWTRTISGGGNWNINAWSDTSTGAFDPIYFPLAQDTAVFTNFATIGLITFDSSIPYTGTIDVSARSTTTTFVNATTFSLYGDWLFNALTTLNAGTTFVMRGRKTQVLNTAGSTFNSPLEIDTFNSSVELGSALSMGSNTLTVTNGTFDTKNFNVTTASLSSSNSNVRAITLGSSTVTLSGTTPVVFTTPTNLTLSAGTSQINMSSTTAATFAGGGMTFYNVSFTGTTAVTHIVTGANAYTALTLTAPATAGLIQCTFAADQTITGTLTVAGATAVRRIFVRSNTLGTTRTLTVGTLSADNCDFRDITIAGAAAGSSPTRAGNCGGNSGITFPAAKTVYWNLAGTQNWSATAWAPGSGGTPDINNFPLAQDTVVFDNTGSAGTVTIDATWNIGTFDASLRTTAMTLSTSTNAPFVYGDWKFGTGVTSSSTTGTITFAKRGTQTITSNGVTFGCPITVDSVTGTVQLADALTLIAARTLTLTSGTFDAVTYNVTAGVFNSSNSNIRTLRMGSGTWSLNNTGNISLWELSTVTNLNFYKGTANITFSSTSGNVLFNGGGLSYNKFTIGGGANVYTILMGQSNTFTELASTRTVAWTWNCQFNPQTFGKWTISGSPGNVVSFSSVTTGHVLTGSCTSGIDYLAMASTGFAATSTGEFYAGANSTGTAGAPVYRTAKPADSTRYWVGGTGNWSDTARWSTGSGGASGASVPRSHDDVVFDSASNATAYTATVNAVTGGIRMKSLTIAGPASGNVTLAGSTAINGIHGNVTLPATGLTRTYTGAITLSGSTSGKTLTTNGVALASAIEVNGVNCAWTLGSAFDNGASSITITNGSFSCSTYNLTAASLLSSSSNTRTISLGSSTVALSATTPINFGVSAIAPNLTFSAGTSQINVSAVSAGIIAFDGVTFNNITFTSTALVTPNISGPNTFNNVTITGRTSVGVANLIISSNQTVTGTFTCSAGTDATMRHFVRSDTIGTTRTLTCAAVSLTDVDFRDITVAGAAAPATGTRLGDCKGNSGITFTAAANKYWNLAAGGNWGGAIGWATSSGGTPAINNFPLAQDTCFFEATGLNSGATITINADYNIGTIDMSARTTNTMTLATGLTTPAIYGNWINGTGTTITGTGTPTFAGRGSQTVTSAGITFTQAISINSPGGSLTFLDAFTSSSGASGALGLVAGTLNANIYNVTLSTGGISSNNANVRTLAVGSGTWTLGASGFAWNAGTSTNLTVTGTGTISLTSASAKTFGGGNISFTNITLNQGGAGTLNISNSNTFANITNTYKATGATTIAMGTTTQRVGNFTAAGEATRLLTLTGTSSTSPCTLIHTGTGTAANVDYLVITGVRAY